MHQWTPASAGSLGGVSARVIVPLVGTGAVATLATEPAEGSVLALLAFICAAFVVPPRPAWSLLLPLMRGPLQLLMPIVGVAALGAIELATDLPGLSASELLLVLAVTSVLSVLLYAPSSTRWTSRARVRTAVIGSARSAQDIARELQLAGIPDYTIVGRVAVESDDRQVEGEVPLLGDLDHLTAAVETHDLQLLVMAKDVPRFRVFEQVSGTVLHLPVRLWELSGFYEDVFGHVPVAEINAAWFQYIAHPKYRAVAPRSKRALDLLVAVVVGLPALPVVGLLALLIRRDGGPALFKQSRIGEGGRPVTVFKLRTMTVQTSPSAAQWATDEDARITRLGSFLRRSHLDELPQLLNVARGEMSLVGPRPEQPAFVDRLEELLPFYQRRHLMKPGITGWAQVRCGYAGSDIGSAWKLSHDLYYLKHRSIAFDLAILGETFRTFFADRRYAIEPKFVSFIHGNDFTVVQAAPEAAPLLTDEPISPSAS